MDRLTQLRGEAGSSKDSFDTSSAQSEAYLTANESSKYFSLSEEDSSFVISPDVSLNSTAADGEKPITGTDQLLANLSPISKQNELLDSYKFGKQIEAANILSGGVNIFDDNESSYDGDGLVIDDNVVDPDDKSNPEQKDAAPGLLVQKEDDMAEASDVASKDTEIVLQIDGKNVSAINIGNGLYLYRKEGQEELAAVQIIDDDKQQPSFKFLKVRENAEGNLEVYEEIEIEVPKETPTKDGKQIEKKITSLPTNEKSIVNPDAKAVQTLKSQIPTELAPGIPEIKPLNKETTVEPRTENLNNKMTKFNETLKWGLHSTPNKEGIPLTKTMVDQQLHPNRHMDKVKTIEVHTETKKILDTQASKTKDTTVESEVHAGKSSSIEPVEIAVKLIDSQVDKVIDTKTQVAPDLKLESKTVNSKLSESSSKTDTTENEQIQVTPHSKLQSEDGKSKRSEKYSNQEAKSPKQENEIKIAVTEINKKEIQNKTEDPTESCNSKKYDSLEHPKRDMSQGHVLKGSLDIASNTDISSKFESKNSSEVTISSNVNEKLGDTLEVKNIKTDKIKINTEPITRNENSESNKLRKENNIDNAIESTTQKHNIVDSSKDIKTVDKINDPELPQTRDENYKKVDEIKLPIKRENTKAIESTNTKIDKTDDPIECKTQIEHDTDVADCEKPVLHQIKPVPTMEQKVKPTENSNVGKKEMINNEFVKFEKHSVPEYSKLTQNTMTTPSSSDISGSKKIETKIPTTLSHSEKFNKMQNLFHDINKVTQKNAKSTNIPMKVTSDDIKMSIKGDTKCVPLNFSLGSKIHPTKSSNNSGTKTEVPQTSGQVEGTKGIIISQNFGSKTLKSEASQPIPDKKLEMSKVAPPKNLMPVTVHSLPDSKMNIKRDVVTLRASSNFEIKPNNNNHTEGVPFGKWTDTNRQDYVNRLKESKTTPNTNAKQIKQPNDLNKREFLQKIDIQRQNTYTTVKLNERRVAPKLNLKTDTKTLVNKPTVTSDVTFPVKMEASGKSSLLASVVSVPDKTITKAEVAKSILQTVAVAQSNMTVPHDNTQQKRNQELIDKTIEGIINRVITAPPEDLTPSTSNVVATDRKNDIKLIVPRTIETQAKNTHPASLDAIEMKMNELHGIPFIERPPHQLPKLFNQDVKTYSKADTKKDKVTSTSSGSTSHMQKNLKQNVIDVDSEEEIIEHEPVTGDMDIKTRPLIKSQITTQSPASQTVPATTNTYKTDAIITEKDFDKFVRRNSITYENQLSFEASNAVSKIVEKDQPPTKKYSRNELLLAEAKVKSDQKQQHRINHPNKIVPKPLNDDAQNKNYQSKLQMAYQSALTAKRKSEPPPPVLVLEDKPVKVMFVNESSGFTPSQLIVQGNALSPKKKISDVEVITTKNDCQDSYLMENVASKIENEDIKSKGRQRKQILTAVDTPELEELIEPHDLGMPSSPKKKRRTVESPFDESPKNLPLKTYLLGRNKVVEDTESPPQDLSKTQMVCNNPINVSDTATAIDNLVKAAELLETQSENLNLNSSTHSVDSQVSQPTPLKRGRGRPRKYPLVESPVDKIKVESPQKKPRLTVTTPTLRKDNTLTDEDTSDEEMIRENWTMGKINEKIVCPICKKLFRSENVVFKHVKHCTGPSPNRSESDNVSRKSIQSQESETKSVDSKSDDVDYEPPEEKKPKIVTPKKLKSKNAVPESSRDFDDIIIIEDTPKSKPHESRISNRAKPLSKDSLSCDVCGKTFRQLSYLVNHKLQHKKEELKNVDDIPEVAAKSVLCCEVCKKEFRKLHHLVQHRLIHNPTTAPVRSSRKSSFESIEQRSKNTESFKPVEDPSAGFRCEPCDKSFRKLHHLVEHRETHDGQNRQKSVPAAPAPEDKASDPPPQCNICKKTFRKLHHLIEHKEQHLEATSEKSDDKSVKSSLSTKDIIHECRLCYMVFPNEHSLNKHSVFCQRKKKPAVKPPQPDEEVAIVIDSPEPAKEQVTAGAPIPAVDQNVTKQKEISPHPPQTSKPVSSSAIKEIEIVNVVPEKVTPKENQITLIETIEEIVNIKDKASVVKTITKRMTPVREKVTAPVTKRPKPSNMPLPVIKKVQSVTESSDDDDVRYMINPEYKPEPSVLFMKVRANKRNSLQIAKPNKELVKHRASLQHPTKPRFQPVVDDRVVPTKSTAFIKNTLKVHKPEPAPSTDSDDSDVNIKYSFPETVTKESATSDAAETKKVAVIKRKSIMTSNPAELKKVAKVRRTSIITTLNTAEPKRVAEVKRKSFATTSDSAETKKVAKVRRKSIITTSNPAEPKKVAEVKRKSIITTSNPAESKGVAEVKRKSITNKRKSLSGMAKRISLGKPPVYKQKVTSPAPVKVIKRRTLGVEHRCDCGQLFSSAALLSRHTTLSHTPPRIRRRRSPLPPPDRARNSTSSRTSTDHANTTKKSIPGNTVTDKDKTPRQLKASGKKDEAATSSKKDEAVKSTKKDEAAKSIKKDEGAKSAKSGILKSRLAHRGVPMPEKMKKLAAKLKG